MSSTEDVSHILIVKTQHMCLMCKYQQLQRKRLSYLLAVHDGTADLSPVDMLRAFQSSCDQNRDSVSVDAFCAPQAVKYIVCYGSKHRIELR